MLNEWIMGWDVGGAHVKAACVAGDGSIRRVAQFPCLVWEGVSGLNGAISSALDANPERPDRHAVTMTAELVDLFESRAQGVGVIVDTIQVQLCQAPVLIYAGHKGFLDPSRALTVPGQVASANWLASATFAAARTPQGLFVDVGSTTTDIVPLSNGEPITRGLTDLERLRHAELVYTGVVRTPVRALAERVPFQGAWAPLMAEEFATTADVYRLLSRLPRHADLIPSADRGGKTEQDSARRLARMLGTDMESTKIEAYRRVAAFLAERQLRDISDACEYNLSLGLLSGEAPLVGAGVGRFLVREIATRLERPYVDFSGLLPRYAASTSFDVADCAPAVAVACLAQAHLQNEALASRDRKRHICA